MRTYTLAVVVTLGLLSSGFYLFYRSHGGAAFVVLALLVAMLGVQDVILRITRGNTLEGDLPNIVVRMVFPLLFAAALWMSILVPRWYLAGNALVTALIALIGLFLVIITVGCTAIVIALVRRRIH